MPSQQEQLQVDAGEQLAAEVDAKLALDASESGYTSDEPACRPGRSHYASPRKTAYTAHPAVRKLLEDKIPAAAADGGDEGGRSKEVGDAIADVAIKTIEYQLALFEAQTKKNVEICLGRKGIDPQLVFPEAPDGKSDKKSGGSLVDIVASSIASQLGKDRENDLAVLESIKDHPALKKVLYRFERAPFSSLLTLFHRSSGGGDSKQQAMASTDVELDNLILLNEKFMRARMSLDDLEAAKRDTLASELGVNDAERQVLEGGSKWKEWMIGLGRDGATVFEEHTTTAGVGAEYYTLQRADFDSLPGLKTLHHKRKSSINVRTLRSFKQNFAHMTKDMFEDFDWSNVFIAGGLVLAALTATTEEEIKAAEGSDIDLYLYAVSAEEAEAKLSQIELAFKLSLPTMEDGTKMEYVVSRSSKTVTFLPARYPNRRLQVILKLCSSPMSILSNFDLDPVGVGFDGEEVWMLPRTVRALFTGFTTFTMDLIHGSYLNQRRATQDTRVWKYGRRGYGLRFLPSYVDAVKMKVKEVDGIYDITFDRQNPPPPAVPDAENEQSALELLLQRERLAVDWYVAVNTLDEPRYDPADVGKQHPLPPTVPSVLTCDEFGVPEVAYRHSMGSFALFARHIALNEYNQLGQVVIQQNADMFDAAYHEDVFAYNDAPNVRFDESFTLDAYQQGVKEVSNSDFQVLRDTFTTLGFDLGYRDPIDKLDSDERVAQRVRLERQIVRPSLSSAWGRRPTRLVLMPRKLYEYANGVMPQGTFFPVFNLQLEDQQAAQALQAQIDQRMPTGVYVYWRQQEDAVWQLVNRQQDELAEMLYVMERITRLDMNLHDTVGQFQRVTSRRLVRPTLREEMSALSRWVKQPLGRYSGDYQRDEIWLWLNASFDVLRRRMEIRPGDVSAAMGERDGWYFENMDQDGSWARKVLRLTLNRGEKRKSEEGHGSGSTA